MEKIEIDAGGMRFAAPAAGREGPRHRRTSPRTRRGGDPHTNQLELTRRFEGVR